MSLQIDKEKFYNVQVFEVFFFAWLMNCTINAWRIFTSSYDETSNVLDVLSYEFVRICRVSVIYENSFVDTIK